MIVLWYYTIISYDKPKYMFVILETLIVDLKKKDIMEIMDICKTYPVSLLKYS